MAGGPIMTRLGATQRISAPCQWLLVILTSEGKGCPADR